MNTTINHQSSKQWGQEKLQILLHRLFLKEPLASMSLASPRTSLELTVEYINRYNDEQKEIFEWLKKEH